MRHQLFIYFCSHLCWHWACLQSRPYSSLPPPKLPFYLVHSGFNVCWSLEYSWVCEGKWHQGCHHAAWDPSSWKGRSTCWGMGLHILVNSCMFIIVLFYYFAKLPGYLKIRAIPGKPSNTRKTRQTWQTPTPTQQNPYPAWWVRFFSR